jgi:hypothetical protein
MHHKPPVLQSDCQIQCTVGYRMKRKFPQSIRMSTATVSALLDVNLEAGDTLGRNIFGENLTPNVNTGAAWQLFEQQIENYAATFKDEVPIFQNRRAQLGD